MITSNLSQDIINSKLKIYILKEKMVCLLKY